MQQKWYLSTWIIAILFALWLFIIPPIIGIILLILRYKQDKRNKQRFLDIESEVQKMKDFNESIGFRRYEDVTKKVDDINSEIQSLISERDMKKQEILDETQKECSEILSNTKIEQAKIISDTENKKNAIEEEINKLNSRLVDMNSLFEKKTHELIELKSSISDLDEKNAKKSKQLITQENKIRKLKEIYRSIDYCINNFFEYIPTSHDLKLDENSLVEVEAMIPTITAHLNAMNVKDLRKAYRENDKNIETIFEQYSNRYTTKANAAIYKLMVIALRAELQNVLLNLKYDKLDNAIDNIKEICSKYLAIAGKGNQSIVGTLTKFIGEIEYLFINAVKIEYNYYVKKEQARQEQLAIKEQMRQEAEERKALEAEKKKIAQEEEKFNIEINKLQDQMKAASDAEMELLKSRILELQSQLSDVVVKKEQISNLANGKAGNVYIISNLGSFGDDVFKIGMTRRLDPQERVNELGSASVPFKFDVHSFIFSDDAVGLESKLHSILNEKRVNKVNLRKEFFKVSIEELEELVNEIEPTAEFNRTMLAEEYHQSLSGEIYDGPVDFVEEDDE